MDDRSATTPGFVAVADDNFKNVWSVGNPGSNDLVGAGKQNIVGIRKNSGNGKNFDTRIWYKNKQ